MSSLVGKQIENYKIVEKLGEGGMGIVYRAIELGLDRDVAMKQIIPLQASDERFRKRFLDEAKTAASLKHGNIVTIHRLLPETEYGMFIVMEYLDGITLADYLKQRGAMPYREALSIFKQLLGALQYAHRQNVIHRDIKPGNIMLTKDGTPKLLDFGLAKIQHDDFDKTRTFHSVGTVQYMSPEQLDLERLADLDHRTDIYSLGMTLYEMLVGKSPLDEISSSYSTGGFALIHYQMNYIRTRDFTPPDEVNPDIPPGVSKVVMKSLAKDPDRRFQNSEEMKNAIKKIEHERHEPEPNFFADLSAAMRDFAASGKRTVHRLGSRLNWGGVVDFIETYRYPILFGTMAMAALIVLVSIFKGNDSDISLNGNHTNPVPEAAILTIEVSPPDALVDIDGKVIDNLQLQQMSLRPGSHEIYISRDGYKPIWDEFELVSGVTETLTYTLEPEAQPKVDPPIVTFELSPATAQLSVDGKNIGRKERVDMELEQGNHEVIVWAQNYERKVLNLYFESGEQKTIRIELDRKPPPQKGADLKVADLKVTTDPAGASVFIDGDPWGVTADNGLLIKSVPLGFHEIKVTKDGYKDYVYNYEVIQQSVNPFFCRLPPQNIVTVVAVEKSGRPIRLVNIYVDGRPRGTTPRQLFLDDGTYNFELRHNSYITFSRSVTISRNIRLECVLEKR